MLLSRGKFIVIDGTDGSGKATQTKLLAERLERTGFDVKVADFPQFNTKSAGIVEEYLSGKYGSPEEVGPYRASIFYACDRYDASFKIKKWLSQNKIVISNRYVTANMGHQGGKINNLLERKHFFDWLYGLEYEIFNIPRPDLNIILHIPAEISQRLARRRQKQDWKGKTKDIHEDSLVHLKNSEQAYLQIVKTFPDFILIECAPDGAMLGRAQVSDLIWRQVANRLKIFPKTIEPAAKRKMIIKRIIPTAFMPTRAEYNQPLFNLYSAVGVSLAPHQTSYIRTGLKIYLPKNYDGLIMDYPDNLKNNLIASKNKISYELTSEIIIGLTNLSREPIIITAGQKIAQMLIIG
ncbi:MAG: deoxynucleoside kinase [bacterium]|nr:deoxynucleoside kinase [bacterium]